MNIELERQRFEHYYSDEGKTPRAIEKDSAGYYLYTGAYSAWTTWQICAAIDRSADNKEAENE